MIEFSGVISTNNRKKIIKKEKIVFFLAILIPVSIAVIVTIILSIKINIIILIFLIPLMFFLSIPLFPLNKKTLDTMIPIKIQISETLVVSEGNNFKCSNKSIDIKKIVDYGDHFQLYFKWPHKSYKFLCQKDLIIKGTLEEFELFFKDKIIKK